MNIKAQIRKNWANLPGWHTRRKIVVIESDDWGSIRMPEFENIRSIRPGYGLHAGHYKEVPVKRAKAIWCGGRRRTRQASPDAKKQII